MFSNNVLKRGEVIQLLKANIQKPRNYKAGYASIKNCKKFEGKISYDQFEIQKVIAYRNAFLPQITGKVYDSSQGTEIVIQLKIHTLVLILMIIWFGGISFGFIAILASTLSGDNYFLYSLVPLAMLVFGVLLVKSDFGRESEKSKRELKKILNARIKTKGDE